VGVDPNFHISRPRTCFRPYRGRRVPISCFALLNSFSTVPRASDPSFMFGDSVLIFGGTEGDGSCFHFFRSRTRFRRYQGRQIPFSCFALPESFSTVPRAIGVVFMFFAPGLVLGGTEGIRSRFHVLRSQNHLRRFDGVGSRFNVLRSWTHLGQYRGRQFLFSCFVLPDSFWALPRAPGLVFMFCAPELVLGRTEVVGSRFHVLLSRTHFRRYRGRRP
jgi:hypothetical protein